MNEKDFKRLIKKNLYQVFLFTSPLPRPISFIDHPWIVTSNKGKINRWEVKQYPGLAKKTYGHISINWINPWLGYKKNPWGKSNKRFESVLRYQLEGKKGSLAQEMVNFVEKNYKKYPHYNRYHPVFGPHCQTFVQWIINKFPESRFKLSWMAFGKNYKN